MSRSTASRSSESSRPASCSGTPLSEPWTSTDPIDRSTSFGNERFKPRRGMLFSLEARPTVCDVELELSDHYSSCPKS